MDVYERGTSIVCEREMVLETERMRERESNSELVWMFIKERQRL